MANYLFFMSVWFSALFSFGQSPKPVAITQALSLTAFEPGKKISATVAFPAGAFQQLRRDNVAIDVLLQLDNVPASLADKLRLSGTQLPEKKLSGSNGTKSLIFSQPWTSGTNPLSLTITNVDAPRETQNVIISLNEPVDNSPGIERAPEGTKSEKKTGNEKFVLDFCKEVQMPLTVPNGRTWAYTRAGKKVQLQLNHINPLRYKVSVDAATVALNTDPAKALADAKGILESFKSGAAGTAADSIVKESSADKIRVILAIRSSLNEMLTKMQKLECLSDAQLDEIDSLVSAQSQELKNRGYVDATMLAIVLKRLSNEISSQLKKDTLSQEQFAKKVDTLLTRNTALSATLKKRIDSLLSTTLPPKDILKKRIDALLARDAALRTAIKTEVDKLFADQHPLSSDERADLSDLAAYAKTEGLAKEIFTTLGRLGGVRKGAELITRSIEAPRSNADLLRFTMTTTDRLDSTATPVKQFYDVSVVGSFKFDFSAGLIMTGLADEVKATYDELTTQTLPVDGGGTKEVSVIRQRPADERHDRITLALATLGHLYWRTAWFKGGLNAGLSLGAGVTTQGRPVYLAGGSLMLGRQQRLVLSVGAAVGTRKELSSRYDNTANYYLTAPATSFTYVDHTRTKWFVGLTFNFGQNEKVQTIIGKADAEKDK
ncbi:hypothetical protein [Spirosoma koreense]